MFALGKFNIFSINCDSFTQDRATEQSYPVVVARGGMSSQYVIEGFSAGSFFIFGGITLSFFR